MMPWQLIPAIAFAITVALGVSGASARQSSSSQELIDGIIPAAAAHEGRVQIAKSQQGGVADIVFNALERRIIEDYFGQKVIEDDDDDYGKGKGKGKGKHKKHKGKSKKMPPGLAKRNQLPPGLAKRDRLPPGLAKRDIPPDLADRLGIPEQGTERVIVDNNVVLVETATGVVLDILQDVMTGANK